METQTRLSRHNKFISAENIVGIFSVSSDDSFYMLCIVPCGKDSHPKSVNICNVILLTCAQALSWSQIMINLEKETLYYFFHFQD